MKSSLSWWRLVAVALTLTAMPSEAKSVRENNGGNCVGTKSCRPRCITFRIDRETQQCDSSTGIFSVESDLNPWDVSGFKTFNCEANNSCENNLCGVGLDQDLTIRIGEFGASGSLYYSSIFLPSDGDERFTYCSVYPCPNDECAVPEQLGSRLQLDFLPGEVGLDEPADYLLRLEMELRKTFNGPPIQENGPNRFGPLHVEWLDDPTGCREGDFSPFAPVTPETEPTILTNTSLIPQSQYCSGDEYDPTPLPGTRPPTPPTSSPSSSPTTTPVPTSLSAVQISQLDALEIFYDSTRMGLEASASRHDWFVNLDYCSWEGVTCDKGSYVKWIELTAMKLSGSIPTEIANLERLQHLKLVNNDIGGAIPSELAQIGNLTHIVLGSNEIVGSIPSELGSIQHLRRLLLQNNQLTGTIPTELCGLDESLIAFDISNSVGMYGEIPECFGDLSLLEVLRVDDVGLVGTVPDELCDVKPMNGLYPNLYGCWAIACPAGYYEPLLGREDGNSTECLPCAPIESNVIGSTMCVQVDGNTVLTMAPSVSVAPTSSPSISPSAEPSKSPTAAPFDTTPSQEPSLAPSTEDELPSTFPSAAPVPTPSPTIPDPKVLLTVLFQDVSTVMTELEEVAVFERITQEFLVQNGASSVTNVEVISQSLREPNQDEEVVSINNRFLSNEALFVQMQVDGDGTVRNDFESNVVGALENVDDYQDALSQELPLFETIPEEPAGVVDPTPAPSSTSNGRNVNWKLLGSALGLSVMAIGVVAMVRRFRKKDQAAVMSQGGGDGSRGPNLAAPQPQDHDIGGGRNTTTPNPYQVSLSEESSGGWASEESQEEEDYIQPAQSNATSIAGWSLSQNDVYLTTSPSSSHPSQSMV